MKTKTCFACSALAVFFLFVLAPGAFAQASLADGDTLDVLIDIDGHQEHVTCIQDAIKTQQWFYVPNRIRLEEMTNKDTKKKMPVFSLVKYQAKDPNDPEKLLEGGVLQCSVNLALPAGALDQLKKGIAEKMKVAPSTIAVGPLSMMDAKLTVYSPGGEKLGEAPQAPDIAPAFANQSIPIQINLNRLGADFTDALVKSGGGIPVNILFNYQGLTPKVGFKVTMNYDKAFEHYSSESKTKEAWNNYHRWWWGYHYGGGGSRDNTTQTLRETLSQTGSLNVEKITGESFTDEQMDKYLDPILVQLQSEMFEPFAPEKVDPAKASDPSMRGGWWYSSGSSLAVKDIKKRKTGSKTIQMSKQQLMKRPTSVGGVITLANWPKDVQEKCVVVMPAYNWTSAWYSLPDVGDGSRLMAAGITEITVTVNVQDQKGAQVGCPQQSAIYRPKDGVWKDAKGNQRNTLLFPLAGVYDKFKDKAGELMYSQEFKVSFQGKPTLTAKIRAPMFDGEAAISTPVSGIGIIGINGENLTFYGVNYPDNELVPEANRNKPSDLVSVKLYVQNTSGKTPTGKMPEATATIKKTAPATYLVIDKGGEDYPTLKGVLTFESKKFPKKVEYPNMGEDPGDEILLTDGDLLF